MPDRRTFLITSGCAVAAPVFAYVGLSLAGEGQPASLAAAPENIVLRIDGWDSAVDPGNEAWVHINSSWRATWR